MFKIFKTLILIIWIIDIFNIDFIVNGVQVADFLDNILPLNTWFWIFLWCLMPVSTNVNFNKGD